MSDNLSGSHGAFHIGEFCVRPAGEREEEGETTSRIQDVGRAVVYQVDGPGGVELDVGDVSWSKGERDVRVLNRKGSPENINRHRLRMGIRLHGHGIERPVAWIELTQARLKPHGWSNAFQASLEELDQGAGLKVRAELMKLGALDVDTRQAALRENGRRRNFMCALFGESNSRVPVAAYVLTRIAPIARGIEA